MSRWAVLVCTCAIAALVTGCGSAQPRDGVLDNTGGSTADIQEPAKALGSRRGVHQASSEGASSASQFDVRYGEERLINATSGGVYETSQDGEDGRFVKHEIFLVPGDVYRDADLPGDLRINAGIGFNEAKGEFKAGDRDVRFTQTRTNLTIGPDWIFQEGDWAFGLSPAFTYRMASRMDRNDGVEGDKSNTSILSLRGGARTSQLLPVLFQSLDEGGYTEIEAVTEYNTASDVISARMTPKTELLKLGEVDAGSFSDYLGGRDNVGTWPILSLRAGPRGQLYGGGEVANWQSAIGPYAQAYFPVIPLSIDYHALFDVDGTTPTRGVEHELGGYISLSF